MYMESREYAPVAEQASVVDHYRKCYGELDVFVERPTSHQHADEYIRWEIMDTAGDGFAELVHLKSGLNVGVCGYRFFNPLDSCVKEMSSTFQFCMLLSGSFEVRDGSQVRRFNSGELVMRSGCMRDVRYVQPANSFISGVSIELSHSMVESWLGKTPCELSKALECCMKNRFSDVGCVGMWSIPPKHPLMQAAKTLALTGHNTVCGRLQFESLALDCLWRILSIDTPLKSGSQRRGSQRQKAVDEALDILNEEWPDPPTISALARRVGINDCYLKSDFRARTGMSIGEYVRKLRMENALSLIESGRCSILQAATFVGYSNPSHFSEAFKRFYGRLPSACIPR
ncbi:helix-turn-helix domain-containing protein [Pseudodesulfovibrio senegalensis]|uniref:Helix-turn-helix transcriptional regulator n=1 Tax=Pseudodesulfovibrio senegalensis TaxID=1721087 RepID=A0A6N6N1G2_9BACT|nr:AraC family transcriptional regulator [Pseudodesulfovibrio senegalensis]KAB1441360.1 helix-turn-helix transcriptional regulator [Pseudodesulfovibrio senegalensis]